MSEAKQSDSTAELGDSLPTTPYGLMYEADPGPDDEGWIEYLDEPGYTAAQMRLHAKQAAFKERLRWLEVAKAVVESHDAALAYVYERLRTQGVGSITIPDAAVAEIRAVNALRELVFPNAKAVGLDAAGGQSHTSDGLCPGANNEERTGT